MGCGDVVFFVALLGGLFVPAGVHAGSDSISPPSLKGGVYESRTEGSELFSYRCEILNHGRNCSFFSMNGDPLVVERLTFGEALFLQSLSYDHKQLHESGWIKLEGDQVHYHYETPKGVRDRFERRPALLIAPNELPELIRESWEGLLSGKEVKFALALVERSESVDFKVSRKSPDRDSNGFETFVVEPDNFFLSFLTSPVIFIFDARSRSPLAVLGPIPAKMQSSQSSHDSRGGQVSGLVLKDAGRLWLRIYP